MNIKNDAIPTFVYSNKNAFESEIDKTSEIFVDICELIFRRGRTISSLTNNQCGSLCTMASVPLPCDETPEKFREVSLHAEIKRIGYAGNPIIIEFLLLPTAEIENNGWSSVGKHIPAYLAEQWMIQFLPKRLVTETIFDMSTLLKDIKSYCDSSLVNKLLFKSENSADSLTFGPFCCVCRLTDLWGANLFSSCWFTLNTTDLTIEGPRIGSVNFGFRIIRDLSDKFTNSEGVHTTTRTKCPKRNYLCNNPCSHVHRKDTAEICVSKSLSRILAGSREVLDTMVTSILEMPIIPPSDNVFDSLRYLINGTMSLPTKLCNDMLSPIICANTSCDDNIQRNKVPESPVVIVSQWSESKPFFVCSPPCKLKRLKQTTQRPQLRQNQPLEHQSAKPQVEECVNQFTSLSVQQRRLAQLNKSPTQTDLCALNTNDHAKCHFPLARKTKNSKSFTEDFSPDVLSFNRRTGLPLQSSPIPVKQKNSTCFNFDASLVNSHHADGGIETSKITRPTTLALKRRPSRRLRTFSASASLSGNSGSGLSFPGTPLPLPSFSQLLINFEESMLNGRIAPAGVVEGFSVSLGASGAFFPAHVKLPVTAYFFRLSEDSNTPSPYLGHVDLTHLSNKRGYRVPNTGSIQLTLFNPSQSVLKVFVIQYNLADMPANSQTFLRQRTVYMPISAGEVISSPCKQSSDLLPCVFKADQYLSTSESPLPVFLRYLVHLRFHTTKSANLYLHTDIRLIFARDAFEFDPRVATYQMRSFIEGPTNPRFSPKTC